MNMKFSFYKTFLTISLMLCVSQSSVAGPESGKIYRLVNKMYPTLAATEDISTHTVVTRDKGDDNSFEQMWRFDATNEGFTLTNLLTERSIDGSGASSSQYYTDETAHTFRLTDAGNGYWNIRHSASMGGLHAAWTGQVVYWHDNAADATQWKLEEMSRISDEELSIKRLNYSHYSDLMTNEEAYSKALVQFFTDGSCSELKAEYGSLSDDALRKAMADIPEEFQAMALKIKNDSWEHREREFRIRSYNAYSDPDYWYQILYTTRWGRLNNPTGIYGHKGDVIYVFVGDDIPSEATLQLEFIRGTDTQGSAVSLHKGLNVLTVADDESSFFIQYVGTTSPSSSKLITDYPPLRIHIENGTVNGFWNMDEHTDEDWVDILANATAPVIDVKGHKAMFHMHASVFRKLCPNGIHEAIDWWEDMLTWQHELMGIEDYVPDKCSNMACAITLDDDHTYMAATWYRTQYHVNAVYKVLNLSTVMSVADHCFGPAHENGHMNQGAINFAGGTESTNSILANLIVYKLGKYLSRGPANSLAFGEYAEGLPWVKRNDEATLRMQWQLYLYFHLCGVDDTFYPRLFQAMRQTPLAIRWGNKSSVTASEDFLLFARNCCDVAQLDLSDFFAVYGMLVPHEKTETRESGTYLTTTQKDIDAFLAHARKYPKAAPIEFIDDRIEGMPRLDGGEGYRITYDLGVGDCGDVGQYTHFLDTSVKAEGYLWSRSGNTLSIKNGTGAVGFRIYDRASGRLLYLSNSRTFTLPVPVRGYTLRLAAVQADGTEVNIPSTAEAGTEAEQLSALKTALSTAKSMLDMKDDEGVHVGWYYGYALTDLQLLYDEAQQAIENADQSTRTYGQWSMLLDDAITDVKAQQDATIPVFAENTYALYEASYRNYTVEYNKSGLKASTKDAASISAKQWQFVPAADGAYYIQNADNGLFITVCEANARVKAESDSPSQAVVFRLIPLSNGYYNIQREGTNVFLSYNANKEVIGATSGVLTWKMVALSNRHAEALNAQRDSYLRVAEYVCEELQTNSCVARMDELEILKEQFLGYLNDVKNHWGDANPDHLLNGLRDALDALSPAYCNAALPELSTPERTVYYLIQDLSTLNYAYYNGGTGRLASCIRTAPLTDYDDEAYYFSFVADPESGLIRITHSNGHAAGLSSSNLNIDGSKPATPFSLTFSNDGQGFDIASNDTHWTVTTTSNGYVQLRSNATPWKFCKVAVRNADAIDNPMRDDCSSDLIYDLQGRPVKSLAPGTIYILHGQKFVP